MMRNRRMNSTKWINFLTVCRSAVSYLSVVSLIVVQNAHAQYLDPGTGSYIIQVLIAGFIAVLVYGKQLHAVIVSFFRKIFRKR